MSSRVCHTGRPHATSWHIWYDKEIWSVEEFYTVPMGKMHTCLRDREYAKIHLSHQRGFEIEVMFVKVLRGRVAAAPTLHLGYIARQEVLDTVFNFLTRSRNCPVIVAGDLGVGLPTVHAYIRNAALDDIVQTHCINKHTFHTLFHSVKSRFRCTAINIDSPRMIAYQVEIKSGDRHPTAEVIHRSN